MERLTCAICNRNKTALRCDSCGDPSCKTCVQFVDEDHFEMIEMLPEDLKNKTFCTNCYNQSVGDRITGYFDLVEKAKKVDVFSKTQTKETRRIKRTQPPIRVDDCNDREEALMKLAFLTAEKGFDTLVDVDLKSKKVGEGKTYKKLVWTAVGIPVDPTLRK